MSSSSLSPVKTSTIFGCTECDFQTQTRSSLLDHAEKEHKRKTSIKCDFCPKSYEKVNSLRRHIREVHKKPSKEETLDYEELVLKPTDAIKAEAVTEATPKLLKKHDCDSCEKSFNRGDSLRRHQKKEHQKSCDYCEAVLTSEAKLTAHVEEVHPNKDAGVHFLAGDGDKKEDDDLKKRPECPQCFISFAHKESLRRHNKRKHPELLKQD